MMQVIHIDMDAFYAAVNKTIDFDDFPNKSDDEIMKTLTAIKGIGVWTAEMLLIFSHKL